MKYLVSKHNLGLTKAINADIFPQCFCCAKKSLAQQKYHYKMPVIDGVMFIKQ